MKAFALSSFDTPPALRERMPNPVPRAHEVLVRVHASSVNPVDNFIANGMLEDMVAHDFPVILGRDYAGVVEKVGDDVSAFTVGDEVFGFLPHANPTVQQGAWAELIVVPERSHIAEKPEGVSFVSAGAAPLAGITAMLAVDALALTEGDTVLIIGATGGVGSCAAQLAAQAGAAVIAPVLSEDAEYVTWLGVTEQVDRGGDIVSAVRALHPGGVTALLDVVSYTTDAFDAHAALLAPGGRAASPNGAAGNGPGRTNVAAVPSLENLHRLGLLIESDTITIPIQRTYALHKAGDALRALSTQHNFGKIAISIP